MSGQIYTIGYQALRRKRRLISTWYVEHRQRGGAPDPVQEQLIAEVFAEDAAGGQAGVINHAGGLQ